MGVRVYHPGLKTFLEPDPLVPFKYDYAGGDPINRVDPTGMEDYHVTENFPGNSRTMNTPPPVITCVQNGGCTETIIVVGERPPVPVQEPPRPVGPNGITPDPPPIDGSGFERRSAYTLGPSDTVRSWRSGRYHERTAGVGNAHGSQVNYGGRTFSSEFKRNYVTHLKEHARSVKGVGLTVIHALHFGEIGSVLGGTTSTVEALKGTVYLLRNPGEGNGILLGSIWSEARVSLIAGGAGGLFSIGYEAAFMSGAEAAYATTYDAVFAVLSRGRY
jgi:hypothetical protein